MTEPGLVRTAKQRADLASISNEVANTGMGLE